MEAGEDMAVMEAVEAGLGGTGLKGEETERF